MSESQPFKNFYGVELAENLAERISAIHAAFPAVPFVAQVAAGVGPLELKGRIALISAALRQHLPADYPTALAILLNILGPPLASDEGMFNHGYHLGPVAYFVEAYGLAHPNESLAAIHAITQRYTGEFAIRPFLVQHPEQTLAALQRWVHDESFHVRRMVSEGSRTRLPWASRLPAFVADPTPVLALLEQLRDDPSLYVRKSVANNLNDIAKDHPELVLATLARWSEGAPEERRWLIKHALRVLVKQGHPEALRLVGAGAAQVQLVALQVEPPQLAIGDTLTITCVLANETNAAQPLVVDYIVHLAGPNGKLRPKVFKLKVLTLDSGASVTLSKRHSFKPVTIRRYYAGRHRVEIQVNGAVLGGAEVELSIES
ncbi:MAG: DNA alkylation repair protein [Chloroflexaceae bacterium]|jgi:3-methyladenine DNA glycosylase AlkC|nr:DNA alkylation repair protein [Chloroflexaceae bacterium]